MRIIYIFLGFVLGIYVSNNYDLKTFDLTSLMSPNPVHQTKSTTSKSQAVKSASTSSTGTIRAMCPSAELVRKQVGQEGPWKVNGLTWSFETLSWQPPEKIVFNQAFYFSGTQSISCNYVWPDPKNPTTKLWLRIDLNPDANQNINVAGSHWGNQGTLSMCTSASPETCAFDIVNQ